MLSRRAAATSPGSCPDAPVKRGAIGGRATPPAPTIANAVTAAMAPGTTAKLVRLEPGLRSRLPMPIPRLVDDPRLWRPSGSGLRPGEVPALDPRLVDVLPVLPAGLARPPAFGATLMMFFEGGPGLLPTPGSRPLGKRPTVRPGSRSMAGMAEEQDSGSVILDTDTAASLSGTPPANNARSAAAIHPP